jgi:hypothetical protein
MYVRINFEKKSSTTKFLEIVREDGLKPMFDFKWTASYVSYLDGVCGRKKIPRFQKHLRNQLMHTVAQP